jgi:hypothetical protein
MSPPNTIVTYCYRDASNYKFWGEFVVAGEFKREDIRAYLFDSEWFVPEKVGLIHLLTEPWNSDDHILHELHEFESTPRTDCICDAKKMVERFKAASETSWFEGYA